MVDRIANSWGERTPYGPGEERPVRMDQFLEGGVSVDSEIVNRFFTKPGVRQPDIG